MSVHDDLKYGTGSSVDPTFLSTMVVFDNHEYLTEEEKRLKEDRDRTKYWKKWGSYVAERQWATGKNILLRGEALLGASAH